MATIVFTLLDLFAPLFISLVLGKLAVIGAYDIDQDID